MDSVQGRNQAGSRWWAKAVMLTLSASAGAVASGAVLGYAGSFLSVEVRAASATLLAATTAGLGTAELWGRAMPVPQWDRETPQGWLKAGPLRWAARNGLALGVGVTNRIGFWLWYAVPLGALLTGSPVLGALVYGAYGATRGAAVWPMLLPLWSRIPDNNFADWILTKYDIVRLVLAAASIAVGIAVLILVGF